MNTLKELSRYAFIIMALFLTACESDDESGDTTDDTTSAGAEFVTAKVDGADFEAAQDPAVIVGAALAGGVLNIQGVTIRITINNYDGPGTYVSGDSETNFNSMNYLTLTPVAAWINNNITAVLGGIGTGTVEVTSDADGVVEGTFSFTGYNGEDMSTKEITEGSFKANID